MPLLKWLHAEDIRVRPAEIHIVFHLRLEMHGLLSGLGLPVYIFALNRYTLVPPIYSGLH